MILALEGPNCSGKTTLACALRDALPGTSQVGWLAPHGGPTRQAARPGAEGREGTLQAEYARLQTMQPASIQEELALQRRYLSLVRTRVRAIRTAAEGAEFVIADRDVWSFFAHGWARFQGPFRSGRSAFGALFGELTNEPYVADFTVVLEVSHPAWLARAARRAQRLHPLLFEPAFYGALQDGYRRAVGLLGESALLLDGDTPPEALTAQVRARIDARRHSVRLDPRAVIAEASRLFTTEEERSRDGAV